jgi:hypothetical protein
MRRQAEAGGVVPGRMKCICDWPDTCGGVGILFCDGCGGDTCVCTCGGEMECDCHECEDKYDFDEDMEVGPHEPG